MEQAIKNAVGTNLTNFKVRKDTGAILIILKKCYGTSVDGLIKKLLYQCYGEINEKTLPGIMKQIHQEKLNEVSEKA